MPERDGAATASTSDNHLSRRDFVTRPASSARDTALVVAHTSSGAEARWRQRRNEPGLIGLWHSPERSLVRCLRGKTSHASATDPPLLR